jgi:hypothetical protein
MLEELLIWLELLSQAVQQNQLTTNQKLSNLVFLSYLLTIRKSYLFGMAFLLCEVVALVDILPGDLPPPIYGASLFSFYLIAWLSVAGFHILRTDNNNTLTACATMIAFILLMCWDSYTNAYAETFVWRNYANIIVCLHFCIILSLYRDRFIFAGLVDKFSDLFSVIRLNVHYSYFWYTDKKVNQGK